MIFAVHSIWQTFSFVSEIYAAGEPPIEGVTGQKLAEAISAAGHKNAVFTGTLQKGIESLCCAKHSRAMPCSRLARASVNRALDELSCLFGAEAAEDRA